MRAENIKKMACFNFAQGNCARADCKFSHDVNATSPAAQVQTPNTPKRAFVVTNVPKTDDDIESDGDDEFELETSADADAYNRAVMNVYNTNVNNTKVPGRLATVAWDQDLDELDY